MMRMEVRTCSLSFERALMALDADLDLAATTWMACLPVFASQIVGGTIGLRVHSLTLEASLVVGPRLGQ